MRINRYLASAGLGSRRGVEDLVTSGRVTVNGEPCTNLATEISPGDRVEADGREVAVEQALYVLMNKPRGVVCSASDERGRQTVFDLLPEGWPRLFHVGRLDKESEGLLILTNDGEFALKLTHPRYKVEKEYAVTLDRPCEEKHVAELLRGIFVESGRARAEQVTPLGGNALSVILRQGLKRQVRLMFSALGYTVKKLRRTRVGGLRLTGVPAGGWRVLRSGEVRALLDAGTPAKRPGKPSPSRERAPEEEPPEPRRKPGFQKPAGRARGGGRDRGERREPRGGKPARPAKPGTRNSGGRGTAREDRPAHGAGGRKAGGRPGGKPGGPGGRGPARGGDKRDRRPPR